MNTYNKSWMDRITYLPAILVLSFFACDPSTQITAGDSAVIVDTPADVDPSNAVCDPFKDNPDHIGFDLDHGIVANVKYLTDEAPRYSLVGDYQQFGIPVDATLFFSEINVPTRSFSLGFQKLSGEIVNNQHGNTLYEYFSIHFDTKIRLTEADPVGPYQFATISDDGSVTQVNTGSGFFTLLNNDGTHPSRFIASHTPVAFSSRDFALPLKIDYFQGPRWHISMVLLWRPWPSGSFVDTMEGQQGNSLFFDSTQVPSAPQNAYLGLLSRGWKLIPAANFVLPDSITMNPCRQQAIVTTTIASVSPTQTLTNQPTRTFTLSSNYAAATYQCSLDNQPLAPCSSPVTYSSLADGDHLFKVYATANGETDSTGASQSWTVDTTAPILTLGSVTWTNQSFTVNWTTNEPATSKFNWGLGTSTATVVPEDLTLRFDHTVTITGLNAGTVYSYIYGSKDELQQASTSVRNVVRTSF